MNNFSVVQKIGVQGKQISMCCDHTLAAVQRVCQYSTDIHKKKGENDGPYGRKKNYIFLGEKVHN